MKPGLPVVLDFIITAAAAVSTTCGPVMTNDRMVSTTCGPIMTNDRMTPNFYHTTLRLDPHFVPNLVLWQKLMFSIPFSVGFTLRAVLEFGQCVTSPDGEVVLILNSVCSNVNTKPATIVLTITALPGQIPADCPGNYLGNIRVGRSIVNVTNQRIFVEDFLL